MTRASMDSASFRTSLKQIELRHIDPADALETSGFPCLRFTIIDKHGLVEGPSDWDIET